MLSAVVFSALILAIRGDVTLECLEDKMKLTFDTAQDVTSYSFEGSGASCSPGTSDLVIEVGLDECGTTANHNSSHIIYENTLTGAGDAEDPLISRGSALVLVLKCSYEREGTTNVLQWTSGQSVIDVDGEGVFTFNLKVYDTFTSNTFGTELSTPFNVDLRETIYFAITLDTDLSFEIYLLDVIAMDTADIEAATPNKYYIFQDGCANDPTYTALNPSGDNSLRESFSVEAFNFVSDGSAPVYIHGVVKICDTAESDYASCSAPTNCGGGGRRRRDTELSAKTDRKFSVYGGPFRINDPDAQEASASYTRTVSLAIILFATLLNF